MNIVLNGEPKEVSPDATLEKLVEELSLAPARIAIEYNFQVVRRTEWPRVCLSEDDRIEIVHFVGGGQH